MLGVSATDVQLGPNLVANGEFKAWEEGDPTEWDYAAYLGSDGEGGLYVAGEDLLSGKGEAVRITTIWSRYSPGGTSTFAEYIGSGFTITDTKYLVSSHYCSERFVEGSGLVFVGDYYSNSSGFSLTHHELPSSGDECRVVHILADGPALAASVVPVVRNWGVGELWIQSLRINAVMIRGRSQ